MGDAVSSAAEIVKNAISIEEDFLSYDDINNDATSIRKDVISKLSHMVNKIEFDTPPKKAGEAMAFMAPITTLLSALKDQEKGIKDKASLKLKQKEVASAANQAKAVAEFLKLPAEARLTISDIQDRNALSDSIDSFLKDEGKEVLETELKTDAYDLA